jgi:hypothetical protein
MASLSDKRPDVILDGGDKVESAGAEQTEEWQVIMGAELQLQDGVDS